MGKIPNSDKTFEDHARYMLNWGKSRDEKYFYTYDMYWNVIFTPYDSSELKPVTYEGFETEKEAQMFMLVKMLEETEYTFMPKVHSSLYRIEGPFYQLEKRLANES